MRTVGLRRLLLVVCALLLVADAVVAQHISSDVVRGLPPSLLPLVRFAQDHRHLTLQKHLKASFEDGPAFNAHFARGSSDRTDSSGFAAHFGADPRVLVSLGLQTADAKDTAQTQVARVFGFFDPATHRVVVRGNPGERLRPEQRAALVHEITHALQFDNLALLRNGLFASPVTPTMLEGDANRVLDEYVAAMNPQDREAFMNFVKTAPDPPLTPIRRALSSSPYLVGPAFARFVVAYLGEPTLNRLIANPPPMDVVVWPLAIRDRATQPTPTPDVPGGVRTLGSPGSIGRLGWYLTLSAFVDPVAALKAADEIVADTGQLYAEPQGLCSTSSIRVNPVGKDAVRVALRRWVAVRRSASVREQPDGFELTSCESASVLPEATRLPVSFLAYRTDALAVVARDHLLPASSFACFLHTFVGAFDLEKLKPGAGGHDAAVQLAPSVAASCKA